LLESARSIGFGELRRLVEPWRPSADPEGALAEEDHRHERRRLDLCPDVLGMTRVQGELIAEDGQCLITAVRAQMDAETRSAPGPDAHYSPGSLTTSASPVPTRADGAPIA
jgi:Domain of unknown function (DUF222)